jgi:hypothetical protein
MVRLARILLGGFFLVDAADAAAWLAGIAHEVGSFDALALAVTVLRALTGSVEFIAIALLVRGDASARPLSIAAAASTALVTTAIVGLGWAPSDVPPGTRPVVVVGYWLIFSAVSGSMAAARRAGP